MTPFRKFTGKAIAGLCAMTMLTTLGAGVAGAAVTAPGVITGPVSATTGTSAVVSGTIEPHGGTTTWYVAYGTTSAYGLRTAAGTAGAGHGAVGEAVRLTGLAPQTSYHYEFVGTNAAGTITGADGVFSTTAIPQAMTGAVSAITYNQLALTGTVVPNGVRTEYYFVLGTSRHYTVRTPPMTAGSSNSDVAVSALVANLNASTLYHYRLVAVSAVGHAYGLDETATTASAVTLKTNKQVINWGAQATLSGVVASGQAGVTVAVVAEPAGQTSFTGVGTAATTTGGAWSFTVKPALRTLYEVAVTGGYSPQIGIAVRPDVSVSVLPSNKLAVHITGGVSFGNRVARVDSYVDGQWALVRHFQVNANARMTLPASVLPQGTSMLRISIGSSVFGPDQAAPGYLAGYSRPLTYTR